MDISGLCDSFRTAGASPASLFFCALQLLTFSLCFSVQLWIKPGETLHLKMLDGHPCGATAFATGLAKFERLKNATQSQLESAFACVFVCGGL